MSPPSEMSKMKNSLGDSKICLGGGLCDLLKCAAPGVQSWNICKVVFVQSIVSCWITSFCKVEAKTQRLHSKAESTVLCCLPILAMVEVKLPFCQALMRNRFILPESLKRRFLLFQCLLNRGSHFRQPGKRKVQVFPPCLVLGVRGFGGGEGAHTLTQESFSKGDNYVEYRNGLVWTGHQWLPLIFRWIHSGWDVSSGLANRGRTFTNLFAPRYSRRKWGLQMA